MNQKIIFVITMSLIGACSAATGGTELPFDRDSQELVGRHYAHHAFGTTFAVHLGSVARDEVIDWGAVTRVYSERCSAFKAAKKDYQLKITFFQEKGNDATAFITQYAQAWHNALKKFLTTLAGIITSKDAVALKALSVELLTLEKMQNDEAIASVDTLTAFAPLKRVFDESEVVAPAIAAHRKTINDAFKRSLTTAGCTEKDCAHIMASSIGLYPPTLDKPLSTAMLKTIYGYLGTNRKGNK